VRAETRAPLTHRRDLLGRYRSPSMSACESDESEAAIVGIARCRGL